MKCAWQAYLNLLPHHMRQDVDKFGSKSLQELRIRVGMYPEMIFQNTCKYLSRISTEEDIKFIINAASEYSPWAAKTLSKGYLTAFGGHRIGVCGVTTNIDGKMVGISHANSVCLRVARDYAGIAESLSYISSSTLIIGPPGSGKTTLLRDLIRLKSNAGQGSISVIDEKDEIFPTYKGQACFSCGLHTDILSGCSKAEGIIAVLRNMNPEWIAVDEITEKADCEALLHAGWCGVNLIATAHAGSVEDLLSRPIYKPIIEKDLFINILVLQKDKTWTMERIKQ